MSDLLTIDTETNGLYSHFGHTPFLIGAEFEDGRVWKFDTRRKRRGLCEDIMGYDHPKFKKLKKLVESSSKIKVAHNAKFDIRMLKTLGWNIKGSWWCTMNMCALNDEYSKFGLKHLSEKHFQQSYEENDLIDIWIKGENRKRRQIFANKDLPRDDSPQPTYEEFYEAMPEIMSAYLEKDLDNTLRLALMWRKPCTTKYGNGKVFENETALVPVVATMEDEGIPIDIGFCLDAQQKYTRLASREKRLMFKTAGRRFNPNSPKQLLSIFHKLGYKIKNTQKETLGLLKGKFPKHLLEYRADFKMAGWFQTFLEQCTEKGIIHPSFWQNGRDKAIKTGRFSVTDPGFQTLPKGYRGNVGSRGLDVRRAIVPRNGHYLFMLDYSQVEPRILTHYTQDKRMLKAVKSGTDIYLSFVLIFFGNKPFKEDAKGNSKLLIQKRYDAKQIILAIIYGMGLPLMASKLNTTVSNARKMQAKCFKEIPSMQELMRDSMRQVIRNGYIDDEVGRRYRVPTNLSYKAINAKIQGLAAQIMKRALVNCSNLLSVWNEMHSQTDQYIRARQILTVHDETIFEIPIGQEDELVPLLASQMVHVMPELSVPLKVDISWGSFGKSWGDKADWEIGAGNMEQERI